LADFHGSSPISAAVGRFPRQFADFRDSPADFHGSSPISVEVRRFPRKFADFPGSLANVTEIRRLSRQSGGLRRKPTAFLVNRRLSL
jgi:hypothetical protein